MKIIGLTIQRGMFGGYMAYLDEDLLKIITKRRAVRRTVITPQVTTDVLQYRYEGLTIQEIANRSHVSKGTVGKILKAHESKEIIPEGQLSIDDMNMSEN
jgi:DNA-binding NarL/FixJ family response regulator